MYFYTSPSCAKGAGAFFGGIFAPRSKLRPRQVEWRRAGPRWDHLRCARRGNGEVLCGARGRDECVALLPIFAALLPSAGLPGLLGDPWLPKAVHVQSATEKKPSFSPKFTKIEKPENLRIRRIWSGFSRKFTHCLFVCLYYCPPPGRPQSGTPGRGAGGIILV